MTRRSGRAVDRDRRIVRALCAWFAEHRRDLPWREVGPGGRRDAYRSLVSEIMLQQTQVARVEEKFGPFLDRFPTVHDLAAAPIDDVLALWSGLGYYRRARNLHRCAQDIVKRFGEVPESAEDLETLPGVGRYTAGAVASIVFDAPAPIVDGNVTRVLLRLEGEDLDPKDAQTVVFCWSRADELVSTAARSRTPGVSPGVFNEATMELGALVCTPKTPGCDRCPLNGACVARRDGREHQIPRPKRAAAKRPLHMASLLVRDANGRFLVEQRPGTGLWAGIWQPPTLESDRPIRKSAVAKHFGVASEALSRDDAKLEGLVWETSHRTVHVSVYRSGSPPRNTSERRWLTERELDRRALGSLQRRILFGTDAVEGR
ncbi:MAG: A/G-specific adenine glycosylase [Planctomycetota bacterium]